VFVSALVSVSQRFKIKNHEEMRAYQAEVAKLPLEDIKARRHEFHESRS
jgi:hypothetical protein